VSIRLFNSGHHRLLMLAAALVYVLSQTVDLQHSHDGDLSLQSDCFICLKLGSQHNAVATPELVPVIASGFVSFTFPLVETTSGALFHTRARAPPQTA
jgi:hypothetical protein